MLRLSYPPKDKQIIFLNLDFEILTFLIAYIMSQGPEVSFSSCQRNLIKTFQIEGMIALITKMDLIFS